MKSLFYSLILMSFLSNASAHECIGSEKAKNFVVYMHGIDSKEPSSQELKNREILKEIAKKLDFKIALPRAINSCPSDQMKICWGWDFSDPKTIRTSIEAATEAAKKCFKQSDNIILLGFSNGGFVINRIVQDCLKTPFSKFISIAASGSWKSDKTKDLSSCGLLHILIGKRDISNYNSVKEYHLWLIKNKANAKLIEFAGGHELPKEELERVFKECINQ